MQILPRGETRDPNIRPADSIARPMAELNVGALVDVALPTRRRHFADSTAPVAIPTSAIRELCRVRSGTAQNLW